ncbi:MAG: hypothetical protein DMG14_01755 [Acidobacteria bacterium]|nr:MAG: hypothetical protein DMG14_01755 [Acidobacteriota bacterium]
MAMTKSDFARTSGRSRSSVLTVSKTVTPTTLLGWLWVFTSSVVSPIKPKRIPRALTMVYFLISETGVCRLADKTGNFASRKRKRNAS